MSTTGSEKTETATNESLPPEVPKTHLGVWLLFQARRVVVFVVGFTVLMIGVAMIVLPGPAFVVIPIGLAILATEFVWARRWLKTAKEYIESIKDRAMKAASGDRSDRASSRP
jgi:tellurite resistance protein TerC